MVARTPLRRRLPTEKKICTELPEATSYRLHWSTRSTTRSVRCRMSFGDCFGSIASVSSPASSLGQLGRGGADSPPLAAQCGTQKCRSEPYRSTPTLSRSYVVVSFRLTSVRSSDSTVLPPNPAACLRVGVWDKLWDKYANYFETASPQFHFLSRGQKRVGFEVLKRPLPNQAARWNPEIPSPD